MKVKIELFGAARDFNKQNLIELNFEYAKNFQKRFVQIKGLNF